MKSVLILVVSSQYEPYLKMWETSRRTWDAEEIEGVETVFYFSEPVKENTDKEIYFPLREAYSTMGEKLILAFEWALANREFNYISRINSSCYCDKKELIKYVQTLPDENVFAGLKVDALPVWCWGGGMFTISKDIVQKVVENKGLWQHNEIEDKSLSYLINDLKIPYTPGKACSIDKDGDKWRCIVYGGGDSFTFTDFNDIKKATGQFYFRVKIDGQRWLDEFLMEQLYSVLK